LTEPIRNAEDLEFAAFVDAIGDGAGPEVQLDMLQTVYSAEELASLSDRGSLEPFGMFETGHSCADKSASGYIQ
jgi:hypothetical protein